MKITDKLLRWRKLDQPRFSLLHDRRPSTMMSPRQHNNRCSSVTAFRKQAQFPFSFEVGQPDSKDQLVWFHSSGEPKKKLPFESKYKYDLHDKEDDLGYLIFFVVMNAFSSNQLPLNLCRKIIQILQTRCIFFTLNLLQSGVKNPRFSSTMVIVDFLYELMKLQLY